MTWQGLTVLGAVFLAFVAGCYMPRGTRPVREALDDPWEVGNDMTRQRDVRAIEEAWDNYQLQMHCGSHLAAKLAHDRYHALASEFDEVWGHATGDRGGMGGVSRRY